MGPRILPDIFIPFFSICLGRARLVQERAPRDQSLRGSAEPCNDDGKEEEQRLL